tara:strand:+ start:436 stop:1197 length:762 start_codon:yes stop_codon:yes gene_type:complete
MDETLGFFAQLSRLWLTLQELNNHNLRSHDFYELCNLFPKILRPGILKTLKYIYQYKKHNISKIVLYTNNTGPTWWPELVVNYIEYKLGVKVFDVIIPGFKKGKGCRKSAQKTYDDLVNCANINKNIKICFIDDQPHRKLAEHPQVTHVFVNAYNYFYTNTDIFQKLQKLHFYKPIYNGVVRKSLEEYLLEYNSKREENTDIKMELHNFLKDIVKIKSAQISQTKGKTTKKNKVTRKRKHRKKKTKKKKKKGN